MEVGRQVVIVVSRTVVFTVDICVFIHHAVLFLIFDPRRQVGVIMMIAITRLICRGLCLCIMLPAQFKYLLVLDLNSLLFVSFLNKNGVLPPILLSLIEGCLDMLGELGIVSSNYCLACHQAINGSERCGQIVDPGLEVRKVGHMWLAKFINFFVVSFV